MERDFQSWINAKIDEADLTKRELAERARISASLVYAVTTEGRAPSQAFCVSVAKVLHIPTNEVLRRAGYPTVPDPPDITDPALRELWRIACQLSPEALRWAVAALRGMRDRDSQSE